MARRRADVPRPYRCQLRPGATADPAHAETAPRTRASTRSSCATAAATGSTTRRSTSPPSSTRSSTSTTSSRRRGARRMESRPDRRESVVNKTAISFATNRAIGGRAPSDYLPVLEKKASIGPERLDEILLKHRIRPEHLRTDDFNAFFEARNSALVDLIEQAMGKSIARKPPLPARNTRTSPRSPMKRNCHERHQPPSFAHTWRPSLRAHFTKPTPAAHAFGRQGRRTLR